MASDSQWVAFTILTLTIWLTIGPLCIWCLYQYYSHRDNIIIQKRGYGLTMIWCIFTTLSILIERPFYLLNFILAQEGPNIKNATTGRQIRTAFALLLFQIFVYGPQWIMVLKYWKIFYSCKWAKATMNGKWKIHLNHVELNTNFYLRNKNKYGSIHYMRKVVFLFWLIFSIISIFSIVEIRLKSPGIFLLIQVVVGFSPAFIIPIFLYIPMRKHNDSFYVIAEMKYLTVFTVLFLVIYVIVNIMSNGDSISMYTRTLIIAINSVICSVVFIVVQTIFILKNVSKMINNIRNVDNSKLLEHISSQSSKNGKTTTDIEIVYSEQTDESSAKKTKTIRLSDVLETESLFEKFAKHLIREWSMELILSFVEFSQYQQIIENNDENFTPVQKALFRNKSIPKSFAVYNDINAVMKEFNINGISDVNDKIKEYKIRAYVLYLKYIQNSSDLEINISYNHKCELDNLMKQMDVFVNNINVTEKELFELYSHVIEEISKLLNFSFHRFIADGTYDELSLSK